MEIAILPLPKLLWVRVKDNPSSGAEHTVGVWKKILLNYLPRKIHEYESRTEHLFSFFDLADILKLETDCGLCCGVTLNSKTITI